MDPQRLKDAYFRLEALDERMTYKLKSRSSGMIRPSIEQLDERMKDLADYTIELKGIVRDICLSFARKPSPPQ